MASKRQNQVAELIKRNFSLVLQQEGTYIYQDAFVTVTNVIMSPDLGLAKIYVSVFVEEEKQIVLMKIQEHTVRLKQLLAARIRNKVRRMPDIRVYLDETLDEMYKLNEIFDQLKDEKKGSD